MTCVIFCLRIRGDHVVNPPPLKSKSAQGEIPPGRSTQQKNNLQTTPPAYHNRDRISRKKSRVNAPRSAARMPN